MVSTRTCSTSKENSKGAHGSFPTTAQTPIHWWSLKPSTSRSRSVGSLASRGIEEAIADLVSHLIHQGIAKATPYVAQWYKEKARPAFLAKRAKIAERRSRRRTNT